MARPTERPCLDCDLDNVAACTLPSGHGGPHFDQFEGWAWW